ncbi:hypothetical protein DFQ30_000966 [Apophysomyces sp. BC1015]|nr:hypothetical protein DFQ30_000966 [Apophysomyces sp. BC1015]
MGSEAAMTLYADVDRLRDYQYAREKAEMDDRADADEARDKLIASIAQEKFASKVKRLSHDNIIGGMHSAMRSKHGEALRTTWLMSDAQFGAMVKNIVLDTMRHSEMSEIKHTPNLEACGWFVRTRRTADDQSGLLVADCSRQPNGADNAKLFSAAPDLYEAGCLALALIEVISHGDNCFVLSHYDGDPLGRCNCGKDAAITVLEAAINKAEGRT